LYCQEEVGGEGVEEGEEGSEKIVGGAPRYGRVRRDGDVMVVREAYLVRNGPAMGVPALQGLANALLDVGLR
jgi:hypothetical protein